jgi:hypothetical protein
MHGDRAMLRRALGGTALTLPVLAAVQALGTGVAVAAPTPTPTPTGNAPNPCEGIIGAPGNVLCPDGVPDPTKAGFNPLNPLDSIAESCAKAASWVIRELATVVNSTTQVNFTNPGFLRQYAVVFGAATFLTLILWLIAVAKRAVNGVPLGRAIGEAVGYLWLAVLASAFTPVVLAMTVTLTDAVTDAIATGTRTDTERFLNGFAAALDPSGFAGGPIMAIFVSLLAMIGAAVIWVELLIRAAMLYVGAVLGCAVYAGLVDRDLWHHVRRWAGLMIAVILSKPVIIIVLGLATAVSSSGSPDDTFSSVLSGLAIMFLAIFASVIIYRFVPNFGDDMAQLHATRTTASGAGPAAAVNGPATYMRQGIATHGTRQAAARASAAGGPAAAAGVVASGVVTHAARGAQHAIAPQHRTSPPPPPPPPPPPRPPSPGVGRPSRNGGSA